jgi:hypothetical protein
MPAELIDKVEVKMGRIIRVRNTNKPKIPESFGADREHPNCADIYHSIRVEDADGTNERTLLLTDSDLNKIETRSQKNKEDWPKVGLLRDMID